MSLDDVTGGELYFGLAESWLIRHLARALKALKAVCPGRQYHITSGDTEQVTEKLDKGLLDFAVLCELPDGRKDNMYKITADVLTRVSPFRWTLRFSDLVQTQNPMPQSLSRSWGFCFASRLTHKCASQEGMRQFAPHGDRLPLPHIQKAVFRGFSQ